MILYIIWLAFFIVGSILIQIRMSTAEINNSLKNIIDILQDIRDNAD